MSDERPVRQNARERILAAAAELAGLEGPANVALDAVAQRAGVSKGGLLYHFHTKAELFEALVASHLESFEAALRDKERQNADDDRKFLRAYLCASLEMGRAEIASSGVAAALVQDPAVAVQLRAFRRRMLDRLKGEASSERLALMLFLAVDGMRVMRLFGLDVFSPEEMASAEHALGDFLGSWV